MNCVRLWELVLYLTHRNNQTSKELTIMTNAEMIEKFAKELTERVKFRMNNFGDSYEKAKACIQMASCAGDKCWEIVDKNFS
jgi:hypothetical protein